MLSAKMKKRVKGRKLTLKLWDRIISLFNAFFNLYIYKMLKRLEREFCTFLAMVHTCSNFGYEDFWAFLVCVYIKLKKKSEITLSLLF
jgi:hypothetical protein